MLELIIERGMQLIQTPEGEKLPRVVETMLRQFAAEPANCQFTMYVNQPGLCRFDDRANTITTPRGLRLREVKVLKSKPAESELIPALVLCECKVAFNYDTKHKAHFVNALAN
jgi:hypothetical protein